MYAIIETGGKQLKVEVGDTIFVEKLDVAEGEEVVLDKVLFIGDKTNKIGNPYIKGATVTAQVEKHGKEKKVLIYKYNPKKHYHKKQGHRQPYTKLVIKDIKKTARKSVIKHRPAGNILPAILILNNEEYLFVIHCITSSKINQTNTLGFVFFSCTWQFGDS